MSQAPMIRLADRIRALNGPTTVIDPIRLERADPIMTRFYMQRTMDALHRDIPIIVADPVSEYYYNGTDRERWDLKTDFPCVIPPFPQFWIEWTRPTQIRSVEYGILPATSSAFEISGLHCVVADPATTRVDLSFSWGEENRASFVKFCEGARFVWLLHPTGFVKNAFCVPCGTFWLATDEAGNIINYVVISYGSSQDSELLSFEAPLFIHPAILALTFMNLKNGTLSTPVRHSPDKFARNWQKRKGMPLVSYRTVIVDPDRTSKPSAHSTGTGGERAFHLVRGTIVHYADEDGKRLFGKYHGTFLRKPHTRGTPDAGFSQHDYRVKAPKGVNQ